MPNPLCTYIFEIYIYGLVEFYDVSTTVRYLMPNSIYTFISYGICEDIL